MSIRVLNEVLDESQARGTDRNVLVAIAEAAHHDGVTWIPIEPPADRPETRAITRRANCSKREAIRAIQELQAQGELEVRKAQRKRRRISVYRVTVGAIGEVDVDYDRLPFDIDRPFGRGDDLALRQETGEVPEPASPGAKSVLGEVTDPGAPGAKSAGDEVPPLRARAAKDGPVPKEPSEEAAAGPVQEEPSSEDDRESAAAPVGEAPRLSRIVEVLGELRGSDFKSIRVVEPLAGLLTASAFEDVVAALHARRGVDNPVGLLVHLLKARVAELHVGRFARGGDFEVELQREAEKRDLWRRDPQGWLNRLLALPQPASAEIVASLIDRFDDDQLRGELTAEEIRIRQATAQPLGALRHWIRVACADRLAVDEHLHVQLDEFLQLYQVDDPSDRVLLHQEIDDARSHRAQLLEERAA